MQGVEEVESVETADYSTAEHADKKSGGHTPNRLRKVQKERILPIRFLGKSIAAVRSERTN